MKILALDTSTNACSVALLEGNQDDFSCIERFEIAPRQHTQLILPMIDAVLDEAAYIIKDIDILAYGRGPGAFTGVRIATGVVQAISYGAELPVAQISSLAALAQGFYQAGADNGLSSSDVNKVLVASDARMDELYFAAYEMSNGFMTLRDKEQLVKPEQLAALLNSSISLDKSWQLTGNGWLVYQEQLNSIVSHCATMICSDDINNRLFYPKATDIAYLAFNEAANNTLVNAEQVSPVYLRNNVAKKPQKLA